MLTHSPGQNPRLASTSPSAAREWWFEPTVAPAATLLCPWISAAQRKELLWRCSCAGKSSESSTSQHEMVEVSPKKELISRASYLTWATDAQTNDLLWGCSCAGKSAELSPSQHEMVELSPKKELINRAPYLSWEKEDKTKRTALTP